MNQASIFYSWQSDLPNSTNRGFIEKCLEDAVKLISSDISIDEAARQDIRVDKDTKGVSGTPPIAETIFGKIDECSAFVADLSFVGVRNDGKGKVPNPNVSVEYGYARKAIGYDRIICIMNTAFGIPRDSEGRNFLPFDMQHLRGPISYSLEENSTPEIKRKAKKELTEEIKKSLKLILEKQKQEPVAIAKQEPVPHGDQPSTFLRNGDRLASTKDHFSGESIGDIYLVEGPQIYLRIWPIKPNRISRDKLRASCTPNNERTTYLKPFNTSNIYEWTINKQGFVIYGRPDDHGFVSNIVQIFRTAEIWGIDSRALQYTNDGEPHPIPYPFEIFVKALNNFRKALLERLEVDPPFEFEAGMIGIEDRSIVLPPPPPKKYRLSNTAGSCVDPEVIYRSEINSSDSVEGKLNPFFEELYGSCGLSWRELTDHFTKKH